MSNLPLQFSEFKNGKSNIQKPIRRNRTYKHIKKKVSSFLDSMEGDDDKLENFEPSKTSQVHTPQVPPPVPGVVLKQDKEDSAIDNPAQLSNNINADEYYRQYIPYYTNASGQKDQYRQKDELIEKLNYMIHLLEEQQDEKTENVTEELILYLFLGVFVIFVVDSFARAAKYTR